MKRLKFQRAIVAIAMMLIGWLPSLAHDFEVDGICYNLINATEVEITYKGSSHNEFENEYTDNIIISETVEYYGFTYSITSIGNYAFYECINLTGIDIPDSVTSIGERAFEGCYSLIDVVIGNNVTSIGEWAFSGCTSLTVVEIPNSVTSIGERAFSDCYDLIDVVIGNSVTSIEDYVFSGCTSLSKIKIPDNVVSIGNGAFYRCNNLTGVEISNKATSIGEKAFSGCSGLTSIEIPNSVTSIGERAFSGCSGLIDVLMGNSVIRMGDYAFRGCKNLTNIVIPNTVISIGDYTFYDCQKLNEIICMGAIPPTIGSNTFSDYSADLFVPIGCEAEYKTADYWKNFNNIIEVALSNYIMLDESEVEMILGETFLLTATVLPEDATNKSLKWKSSNETIAKVNENGFVIAINVGEVIITAKTMDGTNLSASCKVTVVPSFAQSISLDKIDILLRESETATLVATVLPETTSNKSVEWKSSNDAVATINNNGEVTAIAVGEAIITAITTDGTNLSASCKVTVVPTLAETITLDKTEISFEANETATLVATVLPKLTTNKSVIWTSSNEAVATVDANGVVTAIALGEAVITATTTDGSDLSASCQVTVIPTLVVSIEVTPNSVEAEENSEVQLSVNILPENATYKSVEWSSSNDAIASVNANGLVKIRKEGNVVITATTTDGTNLSATCRINVYSGIDGVNGDDAIVATVGDNIVVKNAKLGSNVIVYAADGRIISSEVATDGDVVAEALAKGIYVVVVDDKSFKVMVK